MIRPLVACVLLCAFFFEGRIDLHSSLGTTPD
jgi:hypothetical protein